MKHKKNHAMKKRSRKAGLPPGSLVYVGEQKADAVRITLIDYDQDKFQERPVQQIEECFAFRATPTITWINIDGIHDVSIIEKIGKKYDVHALILEDILNTMQRPKFDEFDNCLFLVLKMLMWDEAKQGIVSEQVSLVFGANYMISFQESAATGDVFNQIRDRLRQGVGRVRRLGADFLTYCLIDAIVDNYFTVLEKIGEKIEGLEENLVSHPTEQILHDIHAVKRELVSLRRSVWPLREIISRMEKSESELIAKTTDVYLRDVYDHTIQIIETVENFRDTVSGMLDIYLSSMSHRMNAVMKVLTVIATIFMPLSFFASVYGMNFDRFPELHWTWMYPEGFWGIIILVVATMLFVARRKKWI